MKDLANIRILDEDTIKLPIYYKIDPVHDLEIKFVNGQLMDIDGMAETGTSGSKSGSRKTNFSNEPHSSR